MRNRFSAAPRTSIEAATASAPTISVRRCRRESATPAARKISARIGSVRAVALSSRKPVCALARSADSKSVKVAVTVGSRSARVKPRSTRRSLTVLISTARLSWTELPLTSTASPVLPVSTATICVCASRFAFSQAAANSSDSDQLGDLGVHEVVDAVVQCRQQRAEARGCTRWEATLGERVDRLLGDLVHVEPAGDGVADPRDDDVLDGRVVGQGSDRLHVALGVRHRVVRPGRDHGQRCEYGGQQDAQADDDLAPPLRPRFGCLRGAAGGSPLSSAAASRSTSARSRSTSVSGAPPVSPSPEVMSAGLTAWMCSVRSRRAPTITMKP